jgi:hypothetical protein
LGPTESAVSGSAESSGSTRCTDAAQSGRPAFGSTESAVSGSSESGGTARCTGAAGSGRSAFGSAEFGVPARAAHISTANDAGHAVRFARARARAGEQQRHAGQKGETLELGPTDAHL